MTTATITRPTTTQSPARTLKLLARPDAHGPGLLALTVNGVRTAYWIRCIESAAGGRCFELRKFRAVGVYHVRLAAEWHSCDCPAARWKGKCKHSSALAVLVGKGTI